MGADTELVITSIGLDADRPVRQQGSASRVAAGSGKSSTSFSAGVDQLAAQRGLSSSRLRGFLEHGGRISFLTDVAGALSESSASDGRLAGLPIGPNGAPDFTRMTDEGATVTGALPGGYPSMTICGLNGPDSHMTIFAAQVTLADGSSRFVKGLVMDQRDDEDPAGGLLVLKNSLDWLDSLPNSLAEAQRRGNSYADLTAGPQPTLINVRV